jgi:hypothetical protein
MPRLYVIEARTPEGALDFKAPDPSMVFGQAAITGISEDAMARIIFRRMPDVTLTGDTITAWPTLLNAAWKARVKTW